MAKNAKSVELEIEVPDGGIGNFIMDDEEIVAAYGPDEDDDEDFGEEGIAQFPALTKRMAAMGREGDNVMAHVQAGELVIPAALFENDPELKEGIFQRLRDMGIEDPERYVVGSAANSINPDTGAPEFFFKKIFKKVVKGVKKVVKGVVAVVKKVAPIVLPIIGTMVLGPIYGAALGSGIATLINGGSLKDAAKSALISGATGGLMAGVSGAVGGAGFINGVKAAANPANISAGFGAIKTGLTSGFADSGIGLGSMKYGIAGGEQIANTLAAKTAAAAGGLTAGAAPTAGGAATAAGPAAAVAPTQAPTFGASLKDAVTPGGRTFTQSLGDAFFPKSSIVSGADVLRNPGAMEILKANSINPLTATAAQISSATSLAASAAPSLLRSYLPLAAAGGALAAATGAFSPVEQEEAGVLERDAEGNVTSGQDYIDSNPSDYLVGDLGNMMLDPVTGNYVPKPYAGSGMLGDLAPAYVTGRSSGVATDYGQGLPNPYLMNSNPGGPFARPQVYAADGGAIFPRRFGGIMPDEGVPGKDSVRAMLMPGEFVMTTDAVRGLGDGNLQTGISNMYSVMRNLETRGRATA
tara:strand:+ start:1717 stop:3462 length:1746 start_codon:yes stop_codon:yes gene_type:complete